MAPKQIKPIIIFDFDGTIAKTLEMYVAIVNEYADELWESVK